MAARCLKRAKVEAPGREAEIILRGICGLSARDRLLEPQSALSAENLNRYRAAVRRRAGREPWSRIIGEREFYGLPFSITPDVLDPRPDTETLIDAFLQHYPNREAPLRILDLCTGSGCIAVTLLKLYPHASAVATDISFNALRVALDNAERNGCRSRLHAVNADGSIGLTGQFDAVTANPPYLTSNEVDKAPPEVQWFDPHSALAGGTDGYVFYRRFAQEVGRLCKPGARFLLECGDKQSKTVIDLLTSGVPRSLSGCFMAGCFMAGCFTAPTVHYDLSAIARCITFQYQAAE